MIMSVETADLVLVEASLSLIPPDIGPPLIVRVLALVVEVVSLLLLDLLVERIDDNVPLVLQLLIILIRSASTL